MVLGSLWKPTNYTSGQDRGVGRYTLLSHTTKKMMTNLKQNNPPLPPGTARKLNCMEVRQTKELKKKLSSRLVGGAEAGSWDREDKRQGSGWRMGEAAAGVPHLCVDKLGGTTGERDRPRNPGFQHGKRKPQNFDCKNLWGLRQWEKLPTSQESTLERPTGS